MAEPDCVVPILPIIVGTAGHVDHGKTSLVKSLTGHNTDRLKEEQQRGMSIDLAVAPCELPGVGRFGIVDVPGHEDFIRNMAAGAASIDLLLLVVAADDAVMPQTVEHIKIGKTMGVSRVIVVITKIDLVDNELLVLVEEEVRSLVTGIGFTDYPVVLVSNETGQGMEQLKSELARIISSIGVFSDSRAFRMYVRNVFSVRGHGTVVTGIPCSGQLSVEDTVCLLPQGKQGRVRAIETYHVEASRTYSRISSALNLRDLSASELKRGMCLAAPGVYSAASSALVWLRNESNDYTLKRRSELRFHCGTAAATVGVKLLYCEELAPGEKGFAYLQFAKPLVLAAADRFLLRILSPEETLGGGRVLSVHPGHPRKQRDSLLARMQDADCALEEGDYLRCALIADDTPILNQEFIAGAAQMQHEQALLQVKEKESCGELVLLGPGQWLISRRAEELKKRLAKILARYHKQHPYSWGMKQAYAAGLFSINAAGASNFCQEVAGGELVISHGCLALSGFAPIISQREMILREAAIKLLNQGGKASIAPGDLRDKLAMSGSEQKLITKLLVEEGIAVSLGGNLMLSSLVNQFRAEVIALYQEQGVIELSAVRERTGTSRNLAVAILEHFDSEGLTKRQGNVRVLAVNRT